MIPPRGERPADGRPRAATWAAAAAGVLLIAYPLRYVLLPFVVSGGMAFAASPAVVLFAFLASGALYGPLGVLLAAPLAAALKIVLAAHYGEIEAKRPSG